MPLTTELTLVPSAPPALAQIAGAAAVTLGYLVGGACSHAGPFGGMAFLLGAVLGVLVVAHLGLVGRLGAAERTDGPRPRWTGRVLLWVIVASETGAAFLLGRCAFWTWFAVIAWTWLGYHGFFAYGFLARRPGWVRAVQAVPFLLLVLVGAAARLG